MKADPCQQCQDKKRGAVNALAVAHSNVAWIIKKRKLEIEKEPPATSSSGAAGSAQGAASSGAIFEI